MSGSYVTYDPMAIAKDRYGANYGKIGNVGGVGWIDPTARYAPGTYSSEMASYYSNLNSAGRTETPQTTGAFRGSNSSNFNDMSLPAAPGGATGAGAGTNNPASQEALRSLKNRRPTLANAWGGWSNATGGANTQGQGNNFTYFSRFA